MQVAGNFPHGLSPKCLYVRHKQAIRFLHVSWVSITTLWVAMCLVASCALFVSSRDDQDILCCSVEAVTRSERSPSK